MTQVVAWTSSNCTTIWGPFLFLTTAGSDTRVIYRGVRGQLHNAVVTSRCLSSTCASGETIIEMSCIRPVQRNVAAVVVAFIRAYTSWSSKNVSASTWRVIVSTSPGFDLCIVLEWHLRDLQVVCVAPRKAPQRATATCTSWSHSSQADAKMPRLQYKHLVIPLEGMSVPRSSLQFNEVPERPHLPRTCCGCFGLPSTRL